MGSLPNHKKGKRNFASDQAIERIIKKHREIDHTEDKEKIIERDIQYIAALQKQIKKIGGGRMKIMWD
jgi:hypothetical protein